MTKQTALEWFLDIINNSRDFYKNEIDEIIVKAKEIEKEQIMQAYNDGKAAVIHIEKNMSLEQYYDKTFKNETK